MKTPVISVIVSIYNIENYIRQCIDSILYNGNDSSNDIEVILVDDGSTDDSGKICEEYTDHDNIIVIHTANHGLVSSRKTGAKAAHGEYLSFVDGDDYVLKGLYSAAIDRLQAYKSDILVFGGKNEMANGKTQFFGSNFPEGVYSGENIEKLIVAMLSDDRPNQKEEFLAPSIVVKMVKKDFFLNTMHEVNDEVSYGEDLIFTSALLIRSSKVDIASSICGYYYRYNPKSITNSWEGVSYDLRRRACMNKNLLELCAEHPKYEKCLKREAVANIVALLKRGRPYSLCTRPVCIGVGMAISQKYELARELIQCEDLISVLKDYDLASLPQGMIRSLTAIKEKSVIRLFWLLITRKI